MYPSKTNDYYPSAPPPTAPPPTMGMPAIGVPSGQYNPSGPAAFQTQSRSPGPWSTGLCDCTDDCGNCCMTCFCPCVTFGRIAEIVDRGTTSCGTSGALYGLLEYLTCCHWVYSCVYRTKMREQYALSESPCNDCLVHFCCEPCALCQEYRELKNQGFDMTIGWHANVEKRAAPPTYPPAMQGGMTR